MNLTPSINLDELCEEFCTSKPALAPFLNNEYKQILSVNDKWCQTVLVVDSILTDSAGLFSFELHIPVHTAHVEHMLLIYELLQEK